MNLHGIPFIYFSYCGHLIRTYSRVTEMINHPSITALCARDKAGGHKAAYLSKQWV